MTAPTRAQKRWIKGAQGDGWKGSWYAKGAADVTDVDQWASEANKLDFVLLWIHGTVQSSFLILVSTKPFLISQSRRWILCGKRHYVFSFLYQNTGASQKLIQHEWSNTLC